VGGVLKSEGGAKFLHLCLSRRRVTTKKLPLLSEWGEWLKEIPPHLVKPVLKERLVEPSRKENKGVIKYTMSGGRGESTSHWI